MRGWIDVREHGMRLLAVLNAFPYPPNTGSKLVAANTLRELSRRHEVVLLTLERGADALARDWGIAAHASVGKGFALQSRLCRAVTYLGRRIPRLAWLVDRPFKRLVRQYASAYDPDAILLFEYWAVSTLDKEWREKAVVNIEDPPSLRQQRLGQLEHLPFALKARANFEHWYYAGTEAAHLRQMARVFVLSALDLEDYRGVTGLTNLAHAPYGVASPGVASPFCERDPDVIAISGNMFHPPNEDGVLHFLEHIFPRILEKRPSTRLTLIGAQPTRRIQQTALAFGKAVDVTGRVEDISAYLSRAAVSACPVRLKIGVQTKVLEAMRVGTPVVTWTEGNSGVGAVSGRHLEIATTDQEFADKILALLAGRRWHELSSSGVDFVREKFAWSASAAVVEGVCQELRLRSTYGVAKHE